MQQIYEGTQRRFHTKVTKDHNGFSGFVNLCARCVRLFRDVDRENLAKKKFLCCTFWGTLLREHVRRFPETDLKESQRFGHSALRLKNKDAPRIYLT